MKEKLRSNLEIAQLCQALALLTHAGVSMGDGLDMLSKEEKGDMADLLKEIGGQVDMGLPLAEAMGETGQFPVYVTGLIAVGERTGHTEEALNALSRYYEDRDRMDRWITSSLTYPAVLLLLMVVVIGVLLSRVLPVFEEVYASLGGTLTGVAGGLLALGGAMDGIMPLLCVLLGGAAVFLAAFSTSASFRTRILGFWRKGHGDKGISKKLNDARFAQGLALGLQSGLMMEEAVELSGQLLADSPAAAKRCQDCADRLQMGEDLSEVFREQEMLPPSACRLLALGLQAGSADQVMGDLAGRLSQEAEDALSRKVSQIEPALVLATSILVGVILLSVMIPLMNIMSAIG